MRWTFLFFLLTNFLLHNSYCQEVRLSEIPFSNVNGPLNIPFGGGLRAPIFNTVDLNLDGTEDLLIYDKDGGVFVPLIWQENGRLRFDPSYRNIFPRVPSWLLMRDYNGDGIKDIFCSPVEVGIPGVEIYDGKIINGALRYERKKFPKEDFDILFFPIGNTVTQVYVSVIDMPDVRDVDGDSDLDIVAFEPSGSTIYLYRNMAVERGFPLDSLVYILEDNCYGGLVESGFSQEVSLSPTPGICASFLWEPDELIAAQRHSGSTVLSIDVTGDLLQDLILGDISYDGLVMVTNGGKKEEAHFIAQQVRFPEGANPADIELFLSGFYEDINNDGRKDLIVAPNDRFSSQSINHIWAYNVNQSGSGNPQFQLTSKNFLVGDMIYPGPNSIPVFFDHNGDGLMDIMLGTGGTSNDGITINPRIVLYQNSGTAEVPRFSIADSDYLRMAAFKTTSRHFAPAVGDLDGDGDQDIVIGDNNGNLYYLENMSGSMTSFVFKEPVYNAFNIKVSAWAKPAIYDYNGDGLGDLIIGEQNFNSFQGKRGSLNYFENIGTTGAPAFLSDVNASPNNPIFGEINLKDAGYINNFSSPALIDLGDKLLVTAGSAQGFIHIFETDETMPEDSFSLRSSAYGNIREGENSSISFADLDNDQFLELAIGTRRGGLAIYHTDIFLERSTPTKNTTIESQLILSPNPASQDMKLSLKDDTKIDGRVIIYDLSGKTRMQVNDVSEVINISALINGVYLLELRTEERIYVEKFIKISE